jgi:hypothetical protein
VENSVGSLVVVKDVLAFLELHQLNYVNEGKAWFKDKEKIYISVDLFLW